MKKIFATKKIFVVFLLIFLIHFLATSLIGQYIARQIGAQVGAVVAGGLIEASESDDISIAKSNDIYQDMKLKSEKVIAPWKTFSFLISLPIGPMTSYLEKQIFREYVLTPVLDRKISRKQMRFRAYMIGHLRNFINSFAFCGILYIALRIYESSKWKKK
jgi:hypothetical protein